MLRLRQGVFLAAILLPFERIQHRKGFRLVNADDGVAVQGIKNHPKSCLAVFFGDETHVQRMDVASLGFKN